MRLLPTIGRAVGTGIKGVRVLVRDGAERDLEIGRPIARRDDH